MVQQVRDGSAALRKALAEEDAELIRRQVEQLSADVYRLGAAYYQAKESGASVQGPGPGGEAPPESPAGEREAEAEAGADPEDREPGREQGS
jgi:hypothetical protein